jgi:hypothetical protein
VDQIAAGRHAGVAGGSTAVVVDRLLRQCAGPQPAAAAAPLPAQVEQPQSHLLGYPWRCAGLLRCGQGVYCGLSVSLATAVMSLTFVCANLPQFCAVVRWLRLFGLGECAETACPVFVVCPR